MYELMPQIVNRNGGKGLDLVVQSDHVHLFASFPPVTTLPAKAGSFSGHARRYFRPRCVPKAPSGPDAEY